MAETATAGKIEVPPAPLTLEGFSVLHQMFRITGSMGPDDWEWGVTLWSGDPLRFKKLIYEMRFDEASAVCADIGPFYVGVRCPAASSGLLQDGRLP